MLGARDRRDGRDRDDGARLVIAAGAGRPRAVGAARWSCDRRPALGPRVRPYTVVARARVRGDPTSSPLLGAPRSRGAAHSDGSSRRRCSPRGPRRLGRFERRDDDQLALSLRQAGFVDVPPERYRAAVVRHDSCSSVVPAQRAASSRSTRRSSRSGSRCGVVLRRVAARGRIDRAIRDRAERIRLELYTVNQLLAMHVRTGAGPIQAVQRVVDRGSGAVVEELAAVLTADAQRHRRSRRRSDAPPSSRREPAAARTYKLFAAGAERGVDLAAGLRSPQRGPARRASRGDPSVRDETARRDARPDHRGAGAR